MSPRGAVPVAFSGTETLAARWGSNVSLENAHHRWPALVGRLAPPSLEVRCAR
jgi:hypothetical protein